MGLFSFIKDAGEKLFGKDEAKEAAELHEAKIKALHEAVTGLNLPIQNMDIQLEGETVTVSGKTATNADRERVILALGNVEGIASVDDNIEVAIEEQAEEVAAEPESQFYTVKSGDSLSKIAGEVYGDVHAYNDIFEANKPMLSHPDKIYPGQVLRIPARS